MPSHTMETREQAEQAAVRWIARRESSEWSEQDAREFDAWLAGSSTRKIAFYRFKNAWQDAGRLQALGNGPLPEQPLSAVFEGSPTDETTERNPKGRARLWQALAACAGFILLGSMIAYRAEILGSHRYTTPIGGLSTMPLPDGSRITLNTDSEVRVSMDDRERRVELARGEAFFEVAKDRTRPFVVIAGGKRVIAVGTQFAVRKQGEDIRVSVTEGVVRFVVSPANAGKSAPKAEGAPPNDGVLLTAGTIASAKNVGVLVEQKTLPSIEEQLSWRSGILTFRDTPLVAAVAEFNRYNERQLFIDDPKIAAIQVGGVFRSTDLDPFIRLIEDGLALRVTRDGDHIVLSAR